MYNSTIHHLYLCAHHPKSSPLPSIYFWLFYYLALPPPSFPSGNHHTAVIDEFVAFCFRAHTWMNSYGSCPFPSVVSLLILNTYTENMKDILTLQFRMWNYVLIHLWGLKMGLVFHFTEPLSSRLPTTNAESQEGLASWTYTRYFCFSVWEKLDLSVLISVCTVT